MARLIKTISDGSTIEFDSGKFDDWCVYLSRPNKSRYAPTDIEYFTALNEYGDEFSHSRIYNDFVSFYNNTTRTIDEPVLNQITSISRGYGNHQVDIDVWFTIIYAGMVAEENKQFAILKKRIKRLGMHQVLIDRNEPSFAANFSKGKKWRELDSIMKQKGF